MAIIRSPRPEGRFVVLDKAVSEDSRLSWAARGLLVFLLGKPDSWTVRVSHLIEQTAGARVATGRDGVYALLSELIAAGYVQRSEQTRDGGSFGEARYLVFDAPHTAQPDTAQPHTAPAYTARPDHSKERKSAKTEKASRTEEATKRASAPEFEAPAWVPAAQWSQFVEMRKKIRAPLSVAAMQLAVMTLDKLRAAGNDPAAVLEQSIMRSWRGLFPLRADAGGPAGMMDRVRASADQFATAGGAP